MASTLSSLASLSNLNQALENHHIIGDGLGSQPLSLAALAALNSPDSTPTPPTARPRLSHRTTCVPAPDLNRVHNASNTLAELDTKSKRVSAAKFAGPPLVVVSSLLHPLGGSWFAWAPRHQERTTSAGQSACCRGAGEGGKDQGRYRDCSTVHRRSITCGAITQGWGVVTPLATARTYRHHPYNLLK